MVEINTLEVFKSLKKHRGEHFAKAVRDNHIDDVPNIEHILEFATAEDIEKLAPVVRSVYKVSKKSNYETTKKPIELLKEAGYEAFVVKNLKQQNSIKKYFRKDEELCTFRDPQRYKNYYMIHAVKFGADKIKPAKNPERQDEYGTSVISIQIVKTGGFISIKNRYNHTVNCPDDTFDNNPDKIILGLTNSLRKYFNVEFNVSEKILPDNYIFVGDRLVQYNRELNNIYFGSNYYVKGSEIIKLKSESQIMMDFIVFDMENKTMFTPNNNDGNTYKVLSEAFSGKKIQRKKDNDKIILSTEDGNRIVVKNGNIIGLSLPNIEEIPDGFMSYPNSLEYIELPNVKKIGNKVLSFHNAIKSINLPKVEEIGDFFLYVNNCLETVIMPCVKKIGVCFLRDNRFVKSIDMPDVEDLGNCFLERNEILMSVNLPKVKRIGNFFLEMNNSLKELDLPKVKKIGSVFMSNNNTLICLKIPNVKDIDNIGDFLENNKSLVYIEMPEKFKNLAENLLKRNKFKKVTNKVREKIRQTAISVFTDIKQYSIEKTTR